MAESTLLEQARQAGENIRGDLPLSANWAAAVNVAIARILQHLEQREADRDGAVKRVEDAVAFLKAYESVHHVSVGYESEAATRRPAQVPGEPKCKVCGWERRRHNGHPEPHEFEVECAAPVLDLCEVCGEGRTHRNHPVIAWIGAALPEGRHCFKSSLDALLAASQDEVDADLRSMGADPVAMAARGREFMRGKLDEPHLDLDELQRRCESIPLRIEDAYEFIGVARDALPKLIARVRELENPMWIAAARRNAICPDCNAKRDRAMCGDCRRRFPEAEHG